jgi:hypothetical protein
MRHILVLLPLLGLAACATPREICVAEATRDLQVVTGLIAQTSLTLQRGYGVETRQDVRSITHMCSDRNADGTIDWDFCERTYVRNVNVPVAVDLRQEETKLRQLQEQQARLERTTAAAVQQCQATYPE